MASNTSSVVADRLLDERLEVTTGRHQLTDPNCMVVGCESAGHSVVPLKAASAGWVHVPLAVWVCNLHKAELEKPETEWMADRDTGKFYVGEGLLKSNEYIVVEPPELLGYGTQREFSHEAVDGLHVRIRAHRRGKDAPEDVVLVIASQEIERAFKRLGELMPDRPTADGPSTD